MRKSIQLIPGRLFLLWTAIVLLSLGMSAFSWAAPATDAQQIFNAINAYAHCVAAVQKEQAIENADQLRAIQQGRCNGARLHIQALVPAELMQRVDNRLVEYIIKDMNNPTKTVIKGSVGTMIKEDQ